MTDFQAQVVEVLKTIPKGSVTTYAEIARAIGKPRAARAVGNACSKNTRTVTIPCHRVVQSSGVLGGYVNGAEQKKKLLIKEGVHIKNNKIDLNSFLYSPPCIN